MLVDKEYPATHSMSTSWYIIDEEGNAVLDKVKVYVFNLSSQPLFGI